MHRTARGLALPAFLWLLICAGPTRADDFQQGKAILVEPILTRCSAESGAALSLCLGQQVEKLQALLKGRIAQQLKSIAAIANQPSGPGLLAGASAAAAWKRDFLTAQAAWQTYNFRECHNVSDYEWYGGSGGGSAQLACEIRHLVVRVNELATP